MGIKIGHFSTVNRILRNKLMLSISTPTPGFHQFYYILGANLGSLLHEDVFVVTSQHFRLRDVNGISCYKCQFSSCFKRYNYKLTFLKILFYRYETLSKNNFDKANMLAGENSISMVDFAIEFIIWHKNNVSEKIQLKTKRWLHTRKY